MAANEERNELSIWDALTAQNPDVYHEEPDSKTVTHNQTYSAPKELQPWKEFNIESLRAIYDNKLFETANRVAFPLADLDALKYGTVFSDWNEDTTTYLLSQWSIFIVNKSLFAVRKDLPACLWMPGKARAKLVREEDFAPTEPAAATTERAGSLRPRTSNTISQPQTKILGKMKPDAGAILQCSTHGLPCPSSTIQRLPKDYKVASKWNSKDTLRSLVDEAGEWIKGRSKFKLAMPIRQVFTYCVTYRCRYGCILTTKEAFVFRIGLRDKDKANPRFRDPKLLSKQIQVNGKMEYASIPWCSDYDAGNENQNAGRDMSKKNINEKEQPAGAGLTFNLALWFLHILAGNHHELCYTYDPLVDEELVGRPCAHVQMPVTPDSGSQRADTAVVQTPGTGPSPRKRRRKQQEENQDELVTSFTGTQLFSGSFRQSSEFPSLSSSQTDESGEEFDCQSLTIEKENNSAIPSAAPTRKRRKARQ